MQRQAQTQTVEVYQADYVSYGRIIAVLWGIMFFPLVLLLRLALVQALPDSASALIGAWLLGPVGLVVVGLGGFINALVVVWAFNLAAGWGGARAEIRSRQPCVAGQYELRAIGLGSAALVGGMAGLFVAEVTLLAILTLAVALAGLPDLQTSAQVGVLAGGFALGGLIGGAANGFLIALIHNVLARLMGGVRFRMG